MAIHEFIGVYHADGGLRGEVRYVVGHLLGRTECALCDITHGPVRRKEAFDALVRDLEAEGHRVEVHHRNEQTEAQAGASAGHLPCVLARGRAADATWSILLEREALEACAGDVAALRQTLATALATP